MNTEEIIKISIDSKGSLRIYPLKSKFTMIYRAAAEVQWDLKDNALLSPKPREWDYLSWFSHIASVVLSEYGIQLVVAESTVWENIGDSLKTSILAVHK